MEEDIIAPTENLAGKSQPWKALGLLANGYWLKNTIKLSYIFAPKCIFPAIILTTGGLAMTAGQFFGLSQMHLELVQMANLLSALAILLTTFVVVLVCLVYGFTLWLVRLSTFTHAFNEIDMAAKHLPSRENLKSIFESSHKFMLSRKTYLTKFYLFVSMVMIMPVIIWMTLFSLKLLSSMPSSDPMLAKFPLPWGASVGITIGLVIMGCYLIGLSMTSVVVSSISKAPASAAAWDCIKLSFTRFFPMVAIVIVIAILNTVIATPQILLHPLDQFSMVNTQESLPASLASELWEGITSVMLFTLTLAPFCELFRERLE